MDRDHSTVLGTLATARGSKNGEFVAEGEAVAFWRADAELAHPPRLDGEWLDQTVTDEVTPSAAACYRRYGDSFRSVSIQSRQRGATVVPAVTRSDLLRASPGDQDSAKKENPVCNEEREHVDRRGQVQ